jgi:glycosyltransferase involved in cell wall biosynthesis
MSLQSPQFVVAQLGARMHYAVPRILQSAGLLDHFYTDFAAVQPWMALLRVLRTGNGANNGLSRMAARLPHGIPAGKITHWPLFAIEYYVRQRRATTPAQLTAAFHWAGIEFCRRVLRHGVGEASAVYTYNSAGLELLEHARERGLLRVMEQTIAPISVEDRLMTEEHSAWPGWGISREAYPARVAFAARERNEWQCADLIVCGSEFVRRGIAGCGGPAARCVVVPYGVDAPPLGKLRLRQRQGRLHVLVAGEIGLRKGAPYVLETARATKGLAEIWWCGRVGVPPPVVLELREHVGLRGVITRPEMEEHYAWADVFLLPSICEGSATSCYEALAAGLPVITTENAGSVVRDGIEGFIVPLRDSSAIVDRLERLHGDRELMDRMSRAARERASEFTLAKYAQRLLAVVRALA